MQLRPLASTVPQVFNGPSMKLDFINDTFAFGRVPKNLLSVVNFSRASNKSYYGSDGKLKIAAANEWPLEYDPVTLQPMGRSIWEARTNLMTYSDQFSNAAWTKLSSSIIPNTAVSPSGSVDADKLVENSTGVVVHQVGQDIAKAASATTYTWSCYVKAGERTFVALNCYFGSNGVYARFNLTTGAVLTVASTYGTGWTAVGQSISNVGNGWWLCSVTCTTDSGTTVRGGISPYNGGDSYVGDGLSGIYIWGAQLEVGSIVTPYIPTSVTFTSRASGATYFDQNGVLKTAGANLLLRSEEFDNASWTKTRATITANAVLAPDSTLTADKLIEDATTSNSHLATQTVTVTNATVYTFSAYLKAGERAYAGLYMGTPGVGKFFNLTTGAIMGDIISAPTSARIENVGNGWYRCSITFTSTNTFTSPSVYVSPDGSSYSYTGDNASGVYVWGAQLETGTTPSSYLKSTSAAAYAVRNGYGYVGGQWVSQGPVLEAAATNLLVRSEDTNNTTWTRTRGAIQPDAALAPTGFATADKFLEDTDNGAHRIGQAYNGASAGVVYTASVFVKAAGRSFVQFRYENSGSTVLYAINVNLSTGEVSPVTSGSPVDTSYSVKEVGNGWWRLSITFSSNNTSINIFTYSATALGTVSYAGDGNSGFYFWGAQLEAGAVATSYIPTKTSFASRASTATYFDANGVMQTAPINVPRQSYALINGSWVSREIDIESAATNLLTYSENFDNSIWSKTGAAALPNTALAPNGLMAADALVEDSATSLHRFYQAYTAANQIFSASVYIKAGTRTRAFLYMSDSTTGSAGCYINLTTGAVALDTATLGSWTGVTFSSRFVGNGWYRVTVTANRGAGSNTTLIIQASDGNSTSSATTYAGNGTAAIYVWGAQLETGSYAPTSYVPTSTSFTSRASLATYFDSTGRLKAAGQNLLLRSEEFDNASWTKTDSTISANAILAPNGTLTADKLIAAANTNLHYVRQDFVGTNSLDYTASIYAKAGEWDTASLEIIDQAAGVKAFSINLNTGVLGAGRSGSTLPISYGAESVGNGWYRLWLVVNNSTGATSERVEFFAGNGGNLLALGDASSGIYIWGAHLNDGAMPADYLPTTTAAVVAPARTGYAYDTGSSSWISQGLVLEAAGTNLLTYSDMAATTGWSMSNSGVLTVNNPGTLPHGAATCLRGEVSSGQTNAYIVKSGLELTLGAVYSVTFRCYFPSSIPAGKALMQVWKDTGSWAGVASLLITERDVWVTKTLTFTADATEATHVVGVGVGGAGVTAGMQAYACLAQLEAGAIPTSYIPTTSAAFTRAADVSTSPSTTRASDSSASVTTTRAADVSSSAATTRAADVATMTGANFSDWYRQAEGTIVWKGSFGGLQANATQTVFNIRSTVSGERIWFGRNVAAGSQVYGGAGTPSADGTLNFSPLAAWNPAINAVQKTAIAIAVNNYAGSMNGAAIATDTLASLPTPIEIGIGHIASTSFLNGHIRELTYYPRRFANADLPALSA